MASSLVEKEEEKAEEDKGSFLGKVKGFIHDVGEKIEETVCFGKPTADVSAVHIASINLQKAELVADVLVSNPNPIPIPLVDIDYLIESSGRKLISGKIPDAGTIHAHGSEIIKVPLTLIYDDIKSAYNDIQPGSVISYKVRVELGVDVPVIGHIKLPVEMDGEIPVPYKPEIDLERIKFDTFSLEETSATLLLKVDNKNDFDWGVKAMEYEIWLGEVNIGGAKLAKSAVIGKNGGGVIEVPISFRPKDFGSALWDMITGKGTGYSMKGIFDVDTPFGQMKLPFHKEGGNTKLNKAEDIDEDRCGKVKRQSTLVNSSVRTPLT